MPQESFLPVRWFSLIIQINIFTTVYVYCNRNQGYEARVKLAVLDHNAHLERRHLTKPDGTKIYHRKYRKQTKKWDITPVLESKKYDYIPELMNNIRLLRSLTTLPLHRKRVLEEDHPARKQSTIAHIAPSPTNELVVNKRSRFQ